MKMMMTLGQVFQKQTLGSDEQMFTAWTSFLLPKQRCQNQ